MTAEIVYPYDVVDHAFDVSFESLEDTETFDGQRVLRLDNAEPWSTQSIQVAAMAREVLASRLSLGAIGEEHEWDVVFMLDSPPSHLKLALASVRAASDTWTCKVELDHERWVGYVDIQPVVVRRAAASGAHPTGDLVLPEHDRARFAWGESVRIQIDPPPEPPGTNLRIEWTSFGESDDQRLAAVARAPWYLDLEREVDHPKLWLNSDIENMRSILDSEAPRGKGARIRDITFAAIAAQVWTSLAFVALSMLARCEAVADEGEFDLEEWKLQPEWARAVVRFVGERTLDDTDEDDIDSRMFDVATDPMQLAGLAGQLGPVLAAHGKFSDAFSWLVAWKDGSPT